MFNLLIVKEMNKPIQVWRINSTEAFGKFYNKGCSKNESIHKKKIDIAFGATRNGRWTILPNEKLPKF